MFKWSAVHWLLVVFSVIMYLHSGEVKLELQVTILCISKYVPLWGSSLWKIPKYVDFSVLHLQSHSPALEVWIKIWILAVFFNQRYKLGLKLLYPLVLEGGFHHVKWKAVRLNWFTLLFSAEGTEIAFQVYIFTLGVCGWSWKGPRLCCRPGNL